MHKSVERPPVICNDTTKKSKKIQSSWILCYDYKLPLIKNLDVMNIN